LTQHRNIYQEITKLHLCLTNKTRCCHQHLALKVTKCQFNQENQTVLRSHNKQIWPLKQSRTQTAGSNLMIATPLSKVLRLILSLITIQPEILNPVPKRNYHL